MGSVLQLPKSGITLSCILTHLHTHTRVCVCVYVHHIHVSLSTLCSVYAQHAFNDLEGGWQCKKGWSRCPACQCNLSRMEAGTPAQDERPSTAAVLDDTEPCWRCQAPVRSSWRRCPGCKAAREVPSSVTEREQIDLEASLRLGESGAGTTLPTPAKLFPDGTESLPRMNANVCLCLCACSFSQGT